MIKMNEEYIKEYEDMSLYDFADELVEPFLTVKQDLTKTIYIHYAKERDEKEQLQNNWNELKKSLKEEIDICDGCIDTMQSDLQEIAPRGSGKSYLTGEIFKNKVAKRSFEVTLNKMQELQGDDKN